MQKVLMSNNKPFVDVYLADTFKSRFLGYMFQKQPKYQSIMFKPCNSIHTFFMKFNIDVLFLNKNMEIIKKIENLEKGKIILPVKEAEMVIEAEAGAFAEIKEGDKITI